MATCSRNWFFFAALMPGIVAASGQQPALSGPAPVSRTIHLNVVVAQKSGASVPGLQQQDFTLLDNKSKQAITSFKAVNLSQQTGPQTDAQTAQEQVEVVLVVDAANARFDTVAQERGELAKFFRANGGHLAHPTTLAVLTDQGFQIQQGFSTDGNALNDALSHYTTGLREITRSTGIDGADERVQLSLTALHQLTAHLGTLPGRKIVLWISPGWPLLSGVRIELDAKQEQQIFGNIVGFSTQFRQANITLYNVNPLGPGENLAVADRYEAFTKGVSKLNQTDLGDLGLQVLAVQSGGLTLQSSSDVAGNLTKCLADTESWYEITFEAPVAERPNEYHHIDLKVDRPGLVVRTRDGYYAQP
jgi:VWFA-related protein